MYITVVGATKEECQEAAAVLNKAAGFLRSLISKELTMRSTPKLMFYYDKTAHQGGILSGLIDKAVAADKANQADDESTEPDDSSPREQ